MNSQEANDVVHELREMLTIIRGLAYSRIGDVNPNLRKALIGVDKKICKIGDIIGHDIK